MPTEINIKSTTIEKSLELVRGLAEKLLGPAIEEIGFLLSDKVKNYRSKNGVDVLVKTKKIIESKNIDVQQIPLKILIPLLENASLEDDEKIQDKWAFMISNLANSKQKLQNQIFPYLLNQISLNEFERLSDFNLLNKKYITDRNIFNRSININNINKALSKEEFEAIQNGGEKLEKTEQSGFRIKGIKDYEYSNLVRLGLLQQLPPLIMINDIKIDEFKKEGRSTYPLKPSYFIQAFGYKITSLGIDFVTICSEYTLKNK